MDPAAAYTWRDVDTMVDDGTYGGCADHALLFGALARAVDIPVVWVKTMDADWIREFRSGPREPSTWRGHVFLELYDGQRWVLLDATQLRIYDDYDPRARLLPGDRFAYDKGLDPYELVLSTRWDVWKDQTRAHFASLDLAELPVDGGRALAARDVVFIAGDNPGFDVAAESIHSSGVQVGRSGNTAFAEWMPSVVGRTLLVLSVAGRDVLPEPYLTHYVGTSFGDLAARHDRRWWTDEHLATDGTRIVLAYGATHAALEKALGSLKWESSAVHKPMDRLDHGPGVKVE